MKNTSLLIVSCFLLTAVQLQAQQLPNPSDNANGNTYDFGEIREQGGPVMHEFIFTNTTDQPIKITNVKASCGCTTPGWSKEEIQPGESGYVQAQYNPMNRPGRFHKSLRVTTTDPNNPVTTFYIKGHVLPRPRTPREDYPTAMGAIRVKFRTLNLSRINTKGPVRRTFDVYNDSDSTVVFKEEVIGPGHIKVKVIPATLPPQTRGKIALTYDPIKKDDLGYQSDNIVLFTNEESESRKEFYVIATIEEYFPPMSAEERAKAPRFSVDKRMHDFGNIGQTEKVETEFEITNTGASVLNIRKIAANCGCTVSNLEKNDLEPGESSKIKISFDPRGRRGHQQKSVTIFSNDPTAPTQMVSIKAVVDEK